MGISNNEELEFLKESNAIEGVYSKDALVDSIAAWEYAKKYKGKIDKAFIRKIHKMIMKRMNPRIAGKFRTIQVGVMTREHGFIEAVHWSTLDDELNLLCNPGVYPTLSWESVKRWHIQFEHLHPFEDGNGRTGRMIMNMQLLRLGLPIKIIHTGEEQAKYYRWFRKNVNKK